MYITTFEEWTAIIEYQEGLQGTNLDDPDAIIPDSVVFAAKLRTAQAEMEALLVDRFSIIQLRSSNAEYLRYAHAVICWWHLSINSEIREIVRKKYDDLIATLKMIRWIVAGDGTKIEAEGEPNQPRRRGALLGNRLQPSMNAVMLYQKELLERYHRYWTIPLRPSQLGITLDQELPGVYNPYVN